MHYEFPQLTSGVSAAGPPPARLIRFRTGRPIHFGRQTLVDRQPQTVQKNAHNQDDPAFS